MSHVLNNEEKTLTTQDVDLRWWSIKEQLPELQVDVLFRSYDADTNAFHDVHFGWFEGEWTASPDAIVMQTVPGDPSWWFPCTHWMPVPPGPPLPLEH